VRNKRKLPRGVRTKLSGFIPLQYPTIGIRTKLSCRVNISCSSPSRASPHTQSTARALTVPSSPAQTSSLSSETASSTRSDPSLAHHVPTLGARRQQEAEVAAAQERERAAAAAAATAARQHGWWRRNWQQRERK
jgi:hypothetical protein